MLFEIQDGTVSQKGETVLSHFNFEIKGTEKIAIVGRNGAGKTTLLDVIAGTLELDADEKHPQAGIRKSRRFSVGMLRQQPVEDPEETVEQVILGQVQKGSAASVFRTDEGVSDIISDESRLWSKERYDFEQRYDRMFTRLGFDLADKHKKIGTFSGGEQTKIMLIGLLLSQPDVLILDEPTNHLDLETIQWLEDYLQDYPRAVVTVSHDRYFIDQVAQVIWEVAGGKLTRYYGNYTQYRLAKSEYIRKQLKAYEAQQAEIARLDDLIRKFKTKPRKASFARSRQKILDRMEKIPAPAKEDAVIRTKALDPLEKGPKIVAECEHLQIGYEPYKPLREISVRIRRGQKIGVFGPNGTGKSAFLKTIAGRLQPVKGKMRISEKVNIAYFDQMSADIKSDENVFEWFHSAFPIMTGKDIRAILAGYLFKERDMGKKVFELSGGEKARLVLASLLQRKPNLLVLDEPTNNMDIPAKETLESIFNTYTGTILFVSHDRYFLSHVADSLLLFGRGEKAVMYYPFGYDHYIHRKARIKEGQDVSILRTAENQRLIDSLRSVPKTERHERPVSEAEAAADWKFSLNRPEREAAELAFVSASQKLLEVPVSVEEWEKEYSPEGLQKKAQLYEAAEAARLRWTSALLDWYEIWLEMKTEDCQAGGPGETV